MGGLQRRLVTDGTQAHPTTMNRRHRFGPVGHEQLAPRLPDFDRKVLRWALLWPVAVTALILVVYALGPDVGFRDVVPGPWWLRIYYLIVYPVVGSLFYPAPYLVFAGIAWWLWQETSSATPRRVLIVYLLWPLVFAAVCGAMVLAVVAADPLLPILAAGYCLVFGYACSGLMGATLLAARHMAGAAGIASR